MLIKIPKHPILVIDDDEKYISLYKETLELKKIPVLFAKNGAEGLELLEKNEISVFIVDLAMAVMDGKTFIARVKEKIKEPILLVQTGFSDSETIIEIMKLGVFDYIVKPVRINQIYSVIQKALEFSYLKNQEMKQSEHIEYRLRAQLEWLNYKEERRVKDKESIGNIYHLHKSLLQGGGIGVGMSLVDLIESTSVKIGNKVQVNEELYNMLISNNKTINAQINSLHNTIQILDKPIQLAEIKIKSLVEKIPDSKTLMKDLIKEKNLKLVFPEINTESYIKVDLELIQLVLEELLLNAIKYCKVGTTIDILAFVSDGFLNLTIKSIVDLEKGIPEDMEKMVLEPFITLLPPIESASSLEKFGLGLGLTMVDYIAKKHGGFFSIHNSLDHSYEKQKNCVLAELYIPVL